MSSKANNHILGMLATGAVLAVAPFFLGSAYYQHILVLWGIYAVLALSLNIIVGYLGELSFGHTAFFGMGAYASAILTMRYGVPVILGPLFAALIAGLIGMAVGYLSLRSTGPQFAILTLSFGSILYTIVNYWVDFTRGPMGLVNIPRFTLPGLQLDFSKAVNMYFVVLFVVALTVFGCHALMRSHSGRSFLAVRENPALAASLGINIFRTKLAGFTAATALAGAAGSLYAHYLTVITPDLMGLQSMAAVIIMVIIGGKGTLIGPLVGALVYVCLLEVLRATGALRMVSFAALMTLCVVFLPGGLVSIWRNFRNGRAAKPTALSAQP
ncbi:MAG: branched-chain amino acid transporter permease [Polaromonas sp.]|nr:branched-chain amino acid transporter permease [Polaromonas sp.]